jgi:cytochrome P450
MAQEAFSILTAPGDTVARTMTAAMYHLHANPLTLRRLKEELKQAISDPCNDIDLLELERLPFLTAVLKESLRISALITTRAPLVAPTQALRYSNFLIPPNTPVSMTLSSLMLDASSFPSPDSFHPDRWLESNRDYKRNMSNFVPFHRGHRSCIGINLAWAKMYLTLAKVLQRFDFELFNVVRERDIDHHRDCFLGEPRDDTKGVRFRVVVMASV